MWAGRMHLSPQAWQVLIVICGHIGPTGWAWPSLTTIAALTGVVRNNVPRILIELESAGVLHRNRSTSGGKGHSTRYQVVLNDPRTSSPSDDVSPQTASPSDDVYTPQTSSKTPPKRHHPVMTRTEKGTEKEDSERARVCEEAWNTLQVARPGRGSHSDPEIPARREFDAALARGVAAGDIIAGAEAWARAVADTGTEPKYVPMLVTWLKREGWKDRPRPPVRRRLVAGMA
jgi:hypothetical protein